MSACKLGLEVGNGGARSLKQNQQVIDKVRCLVDHRFAIVCHGFDDRLYGLFSDFLGDLVDAALEKSGRV